MSIVWQYFSVKGDNNTLAECKLCKKNISRGLTPKTFSTSPLHKHMKIYHSQEYLNAAKTNIKKQSEASTPKERKLKALKQTSIEESFSTKKLWDINDQRSQAIHQKIMNMIAIDNQPFSITEDQGFIELLAHIQPKYLMPSRKYLVEKLLPKTYETLRSVVEEKLSAAQSISFTTDIWTSQFSNESFISLTAHWISDIFEKVDCVLHCKHFPGSHTGINVAAATQTMLTTWDITPKRVNLILRDSAYNMELGMNLCGFENLSCFIHKLQLVIKDAVFSQRSVKDLNQKCKMICTHFNHSSLSCSELKRLEKEIDPKIGTTLLPIQDVQTRWNSTYLMLERIEKLKRALQLYIADHTGIPVLTSNDWQLLEKVLVLLQPFFMITNAVSRSKSMLSSAITHVRALHRFLSDMGNDDSGVQTMKLELKKALEKRFLDSSGLKGSFNIYDSRAHVISTIVDPRYKINLFSEDVKEKASKWMIDEMKDVIKNKNQDTDENVEQSLSSASSNSSPSRNPESESSLPSTSTDLRSALAERFLSYYDTEEGKESERGVKKRKIEKGKSKPTEGDLIKEFEDYLNERSISPKATEEEVLEWWSSKKEMFPYIASIARRMLAVPASSVYSERLFSEAGNIFEEKRSRITPEHGEQLVFLHHNLRKFN